MANLRHKVVGAIKALYAPHLPLHDALARPRFIASLGKRMLAHSALLVSILSVVTVALRVIVVAAGDTRTIYGILGSVSPLSLAVSMILPMVASLLVLLPVASYSLASRVSSVPLRILLMGVIPLGAFALTYFVSTKLNWYTALGSFIVIVAYSARTARKDNDARSKADQQEWEAMKKRYELKWSGAQEAVDTSVLSRALEPPIVEQWLTRDAEIAPALHELDAIRSAIGKLPEKPELYDDETRERLAAAIDLRKKVVDRWAEAEELRTRARAFTVAAFLAVSFYFLALLTPPPYALEEIEVAGKASVGYVISEDSHWVILLDREDRMLRRIDQSEIETRNFCSVQGDEFFGQRRKYPDCTER